MKLIKKISCLALCLGIASLAFAQKIGVVDTQYILEKLPQYKEAESRLRTQVDTWQTEIHKLQSDYEAKKQSFENEKVLLLGDQLKQREKEIQKLEQDIKELITKRFGTDGEINKLRVNLVKPFQNQIWGAIKTMSEKNSLGIVIDKGTESGVLFLDKKYDYTDKVLDILLKNQKK